MKAKTKLLLKEAHQYCDDNDKSTGFMLQYMQDVAGVDLDCVLNYLKEPEDCAHLGYKEHHGDHFERLQVLEHGSQCMFCSQYFSNETIMEEMEAGDYEG